MPDHVYGPARNFASGMLQASRHRDDLLSSGTGRGRRSPRCCGRTPGWCTRKAPAAIRSRCRTCRRSPARRMRTAPGRVKVLMDNTWGIHHFQPFTPWRRCVDPGGDEISSGPLGRSDRQHHGEQRGRLADAARGARGLGQYASPDDCWLTLRGMRTHGRAAGSADGCRHRGRALAAQTAGGGAGAASGAARRARPRVVAARLHRRVQPVRRGVPAGVFARRARTRFVEALELFGIGASWGGFESLALPTTGFITRTAGSGKFAGRVVRLHIGLEDVDDLIADLEQGLAVMRGFGK